MCCDRVWVLGRQTCCAGKVIEGVAAEAPVPSDPSAVAARITDEVSRELGAALER